MVYLIGLLNRDVILRGFICEYNIRYKVTNSTVFSNQRLHLSTWIHYDTPLLPNYTSDAD